MIQWKRILAGVGALLMMSTVLVGCNDDPGTTDSGNTAELVGNTYVSDFPIVKERITITAMALKWSGTGVIEELAWNAYYEEKTNIHVEWIEVPRSELGTKVQLALQSGDIPDIMVTGGMGINGSQLLQYSQEGQFAEIGPLLEKWGPNIKKVMDATPEAQKASYVNGKLYSLPLLQGNQTTQIWFVRQSWLDNLGLDAPSTMTEYYNMLSAFKNGDPNGNGKPDEIPFATNEWKPAMWEPWGLDWWYSQSFMTVNSKTGTVYFGPMTNAGKEGARYWSKLYDEGLISDAILNTGEEGLLALIGRGNVGAFIYDGLYSYIQDKDLVADYTMIPVPDSEYAESEFGGPCAIQSPSVLAHGFVLSNACEHKEAVIRWMDYLWTEEGAVLATYGPADDGVYTWKDGKVVFDDPDYLSTHIPTMDRGLGWILSIPTTLVPNMIAEKAEDQKSESDKWTDARDAFVKEHYEPLYNELRMMPTVKSKEDDDYIAEMEPIVSEAIFNLGQFIVGNKNIDTEWNTYIQDLKRKGIDELIAIYQKDFPQQ